MNTGYDPLLKVFNVQLKRRRAARGWSQEALGARIGFSGEMASKVESGRNPPSADFADGLDTSAFPEACGVFSELLDQSERSRFQRWMDAEQSASAIHWWQPLSVPGLLQTEAYCRETHEAWRAVDGGPATDASIAERLERQAILDREVPPYLGMVLGESVLRHPVGGPRVMRDQLTHLVEMSERSRVTIQVMPTAVGANVGMAGAFAIATFSDGSPATVYTESPDRGTTLREPARVERMSVAFDAVKSEALSARASRDLIRTIAERARLRLAKAADRAPIGRGVTRGPGCRPRTGSARTRVPSA